MKAIMCILVLSCAMMASAGETHFEKTSVRSTWFETLRGNATFETIKDCKFEVEKPYGILEQTFTKNMTKDGGLCLWKLRAPENHIIHVLSITIDLADEDEMPSIHEDGKLTTVYLWDGIIPGKNSLFRYSPKREERYNAFSQNISTGQDMIVEIEHHQHPEYLTQKIAIKYEFIDIEKMNKFLTYNNRKKLQ